MGKGAPGREGRDQPCQLQGGHDTREGLVLLRPFGCCRKVQQDGDPV